jgi:hypothetical protein
MSAGAVEAGSNVPVDHLLQRRQNGMRISPITPLRAATERFGAKLDALHKGRKAEIILLKSPR